MAMPFTRREALLLAAGGLAACSAGGIQPADNATPSLHALAQAKGMRFGTAIGVGAPGQLTGAFHDPRYLALVAEQCGVLVHENELKWYVLRPDAETYDFQRADMMMDFAAQHGIAVRGHTLLWNRTEFSPAWINNYDFGSRPALRPSGC